MTDVGENAQDHPRRIRRLHEDHIGEEPTPVEDYRDMREEGPITEEVEEAEDGS